MTYEPATYWQNRAQPNSQRIVPIRVRNYLARHVGRAVLDYGVGTGRMLGLYKGKTVTGLDIVSIYREECIKRAQRLGISFTHIVGCLDDIEGHFDTVVASKVFLHVPPNELQGIIDKLFSISDKVVVWDAVGQGALHVFDHNYSQFGEMKDVRQWDSQLLFYYD